MDLYALSRNLGIANRLRVSSAHKVITVNFQRGVFHGRGSIWFFVVVVVVGIQCRAVKTGFSVQPVTGLVKPVSNRFTVL